MQILPADPTFNTLLAQMLPQSLAGGIAGGLQQGYESGQIRNVLQNPQQGDFQDQLAQIIGLPISPELKKLGTERLQTQFAANTIGEQFGPEAAQLFRSLPVGAQTELTRTLLDLKGRDIEYKDFLSGNLPKGGVSQRQAVSEGEFAFPEIPAEEGLTPKERVKHQSELRKENIPHLTEAQTKSRAAKKEAIDLNVLDQLNQSGKLPEDLGRVLINPQTGELYKVAQLAGLSSPETQQFSKTLANFVSKAKESFGARVTNFDLESFMKRLPSLLNTKEGKRRVIEQLKVINELDSLYENSLKKTFQHYGAGKITYEQAAKIAEDMIADEEDALVARLDQISNPVETAPREFEELPSPAQYAGQEIEDDRGNVFLSNGRTWRKIQ